MPPYRITIWLLNKKKVQVIRQMDLRNINTVYNLVEKKSRAHYRENNVVKIEIVMLAKQSEKIKAFLQNGKNKSA
ncbi:hypothetical protein BH10BAC2_BH10BAC2_35320 [soil metagenome]